MIITKKNKNFFYNNYSKKNWILIFTWKNCGFCHRIKPKWNDLVKKNKSNYKFVEIERDEIDDEFITFLNKNNKNKELVIDDYYPKLYELNGEEKKINLIHNIDQIDDKLKESKKTKKNIEIDGKNTFSSKLELKKSSKKKYKKKNRKKSVRKIKRKGNDIIKSLVNNSLK